MHNILCKVKFIFPLFAADRLIVGFLAIDRVWIGFFIGGLHESLGRPSGTCLSSPASPSAEALGYYRDAPPGRIRGVPLNSMCPAGKAGSSPGFPPGSE